MDKQLPSPTSSVLLIWGRSNNSWRHCFGLSGHRICYLYWRPESLDFNKETGNRSEVIGNNFEKVYFFRRVTPAFSTSVTSISSSRFSEHWWWGGQKKGKNNRENREDVEGFFFQVQFVLTESLFEICRFWVMVCQGLSRWSSSFV